jgi:hypothetical protein
MNYELLLTDNSTHISSSITIPLQQIQDIFNIYFAPLVNKRFYDDDYGSIVVITNDTRYVYKYTGSNQWSLTVQPELAIITLATRTTLEWDHLVYHWIELLKMRYQYYKWNFSNIDKGQFIVLEQLFKNSMYIPFATNQLSLIIKPLPTN